MAVGLDAGPPFRCPHCRQIVTAPAVRRWRSMARPSRRSPHRPRCRRRPFGVPADTARPNSYRPASRRPRPPATALRLVLSILAPYAVFATVLAAYFCLQVQPARLDHPLAVIPDWSASTGNASQRKSPP